MARHQMTVVGASNVDIIATSGAPLIESDSNPGRVRTGFGGVGRNIAENLARMDQQIRFITAYGDDPFTLSLQAQAGELGLDISQSLCAKDVSSSLYICVNQPDGEMAVAINDMEVCGLLTPAFIKDKLDALNAAEAVVLDANLPEETLAYLGNRCTAPLFVDTVSTKKAEKLRGMLGRLTGIKTNRYEAELLTRQEVRTPEDAKLAARAFHRMGIKVVFITLGSLGAFVSLGQECASMPTLAKRLVSTTGCGDAFFAGALCALLDGGNSEAVLRQGLVAAAICAEDPCAVSPAISPEAIARRMEQVREEVAIHGSC